MQFNLSYIFFSGDCKRALNETVELNNWNTISPLCETALLCLDVSPCAEHEQTVPPGDAGRLRLPDHCCWSTAAPMTLWTSVSVKRHPSPAALLSDTLPPTLGEASVCETPAQPWCHSSVSHHLVGWTQQHVNKGSIISAVVWSMFRFSYLKILICFFWHNTLL